MSENQKNERKSEFCARIADNLECIIADYFEVILSLVLNSVRLVVFDLHTHKWCGKPSVK